MGSGVGSLFGRGRELASVAELFGEVGDGVGRVVALAGDAGVGKSRLAGELLTTAGRRGFRELRGTACAYQGDLSYAPVVEALRPLLREAAAPADLAPLFGGPVAAPALGDPGLERTRLFEAVVRLLESAAADRPIAMLVDDVHWADPSSLDVLHYLGRAAARARYLLVLTYRPAEAGSGLRTMLTSLRRGDWLVEVPVRPLSPPDVTAMVTELLGDQPPAPVLDLLTAKARGVPLFVRELTRQLRDSGGLFRSAGRWVLGPDASHTLPASVVELFEDRVDGLDAADRTVLEAISVCADAATTGVLAAVCAGTPDLADRLVRLCAGGLVVEESDGIGEVGYRMVHPLLAEAVYARLPAAARQTWHAATADALARGDAHDTSRLAHHVDRAGPAFDPERALTILAAAAANAVARRAGEEGVTHARAALARADRLGRTDLVPTLLALLGDAATRAGRTEEAVAAWREAADAATDRLGRARCLLRLARVETDAGALADAHDHLTRATAALADLDAVELRVDIAQVGLVLDTRRDDSAAVVARVAELERVAARSADARAAALARYGRLELTGYGTSSVAESDVDDAITAVGAVGGTELVVTLQLISLGTALGRGEHAVVTRRVERTVDLARAADLPMLEVLPTAFCGLAQFQAGAWDSALALSDRALVSAHRFAVPRGVALALAGRAMVLLHRGEVAEAEACLAEAAASYRDRRLGRLLDVIAAQVALAHGDPARAAGHEPRRGPYALPVLHLRVCAEICLRTGDAEEAARVAGQLDALDFPYATATAGWVRGLAAGPTGAARLAGATDAFDALGLPFDAASCRLDLAEALATADQDTATAAAVRAMSVFDDLGAAPSAARARRLLRRLGVRPKPRERRTGELSARETEVAALVAQGLSNAAVAQQLFLSPRTVTTHLDNIYRRLGLSSRQELARYVADRTPNT